MTSGDPSTPYDIPSTSYSIQADNLATTPPPYTSVSFAVSPTEWNYEPTDFQESPSIPSVSSSFASGNLNSYVQDHYDTDFQLPSPGSSLSYIPDITALHSQQTPHNDDLNTENETILIAQEVKIPKKRVTFNKQVRVRVIPRIYETEDKPLKSVHGEKTSLLDPSKRLFKFTMVLFLCFLTFGSSFCYDIPAALQTSLMWRFTINEDSGTVCFGWNRMCVLCSFSSVQSYCCIFGYVGRLQNIIHKRWRGENGNGREENSPQIQKKSNYS
eukprot:TRINITY_DN4424_c0_g1_i2.p1 TRINITY_DN4424_c0_g1~~TRINITY_DN4424_c0_g1_i2.p1  ORF type:complete len:271 (-),score=46.06 TRINITY_DN4424_c0_g1_i2:670-1482(-)